MRCPDPRGRGAPSAGRRTRTTPSDVTKLDPTNTPSRNAPSDALGSAPQRVDTQSLSPPNAVGSGMPRKAPKAARKIRSASGRSASDSCRTVRLEPACSRRAVRAAGAPAARVELDSHGHAPPPSSMVASTITDCATVRHPPIQSFSQLRGRKRGSSRGCVPSRAGHQWRRTGGSSLAGASRTPVDFLIELERAHMYQPVLSIMPLVSL